MDFLSEQIQEYSNAHTEAESDLLERINRETNLHVLMPRMISGHFQGRLLSMISHLVVPERILEIGTYTGYSALCLAEGLQQCGKLVTMDKNGELESRVRGYFAESTRSEVFDFRIGDAVEIIPKLSETWDLVFIDADKDNYLNYFNLVVDNVRKGGMIIADNVLWSGKVLDEKVTDRDTVALREFNDAVHKDVRVSNVLLPVRDGLMVLRKL